MQNFFYAPNIYADGSPYLEGILGLSWFPSAKAKTDAANYEAEILSALKILSRRRSSFCVLTEIARYRGKKVVIRPRNIPNPSPQEDEESRLYNATTEEDSRKDAVPKGTPAPAMGKDPVEDKTLGTGAGTDVVIKINPVMYSDYGSKYLESSEEVLLHELVHALSCISGTLTKMMAAPASYDDLEEFTAIVVSNVYKSEKYGSGTALNGGHDLRKPLPFLLRSGAAFYKKYEKYIRQIFLYHRGLAIDLQALTGIYYNPFEYCDGFSFVPDVTIPGVSWH